MAFDTAYPQILANLAAGNEPVALIDSNFTPLYSGILSLNTFGNYYVDSGAANAYVVTITARQSVSLAAGLPVQFKASNANTGASTLNVSGTGSKNILRLNGTALGSGDIPANSIVHVVYDGTQYLLLSVYAIQKITASLGADVALNNTANYFDGPSVAQGTVGTWYVSGTIVVTDTGGSAAQLYGKLWDGTTVLSSGSVITPAGSGYGIIALSGYIASPAGNIRISAKDISSTSGAILFNQTGNSKDSTISAIRIA